MGSRTPASAGGNKPGGSSSRSRSGAVANGNGVTYFDELRRRLLDPERKELKAEISELVLDDISSFENFVRDKLDAEPKRDKLIELLLEEALASSSAFQDWKRTAVKKGNLYSAASASGETDDAEEVLESLGESKVVTNGNGAPATTNR